MNTHLKNALALTAVAVASQAMAQVTFFEQDNFRGRSFTTERQVGNFERFGFNDRASSVVVARESWEVCEDTQFGGRCAVLQPGQYPSLSAMGLNDRVSSVRAARNTAPAPETPQITFYENEGFIGRSFVTQELVRNFARNQFNDRASSVVVVGGPWELCENNQFRGQCVVLRPGQYPSMSAMGLNDRVSSVRLASRDARIDDRYAPGPATGQVTFYEREGFTGRAFTTVQSIDNFVQNNFNDRASSVVVAGGPWELCENNRYSGRCVVLRPGQYPSMAAMGLNDRVSSVRAMSPGVNNGGQGYESQPVAAPDYRRRNNERLYEANVTSVRAVVGTPEQRCWVEPGQVAQTQGNANIPGAIAGALIGGILGHQVGGGSGKDIATVGGLIAGAAIGANVGRTDGTTQDVQRCESTPNQAQAQYWDVSYNFRGQEHRTQMTTPPGATVTVNERGEPRR
ncbi:beta/gamma crystallin-related protein [Rhodoferax sp.]|uniref:beta/gamma crystallin-related protein n=1 Tax=Rhodoferax sp. TaxID=50421 RepID=UPI0025D7AD04|nr:beta/gamma crystallin-related protein [Rhodoferax sp.]MCM2296148.1 beta/gamma crystallin-related protein [Rhodoferax sp.]